jgi:hypothetical protein
MKKFVNSAGCVSNGLTLDDLTVSVRRGYGCAYKSLSSSFSM